MLPDGEVEKILSLMEITLVILTDSGSILPPVPIHAPFILPASHSLTPQ